MRFIRASILCLSLLGAVATPVLAQPTSTGSVSLQGRLTGVADGSQPLTFFLHTAQTGGTQVASIGPISTQVTGGVFSATVPIAASTFDGRTLWWSVSVNGGAATARQLVTSVPYAAASRFLGVYPAPYTPLNNDERLRAYVLSTATGGSALYIGPASDAAGAPRNNRLVLLGGNVPGDQTGFTAVRYEFLAAGAAEIQSFRGSTFGTHLRFLTSDISGDGEPVERMNIDDRGRIRMGPPRADPRFSVLDVNGETSTNTLTIVGGSDLAEPFPASPAESQAVTPKPGMIMSIDPDHPGALRVATSAYDTAVAGVYSGGNGLPTGLVMGKDGCELTSPGADKLPLAMTGRVWVFADESGGVIKPGDRLTTSGSKPGHAMKVSDETRSIGAVIGKAMTGTDEKTGMVLVLVNLQ